MLERLYVLEYVFQHSVYLHKTQNPRLLLAGPLRLRPRYPLLSQHMQKSPLCCSSSSLPSFPPARGQFPPAAGTLTAATAAVVNLRQSRLHYLKKKKRETSPANREKSIEEKIRWLYHVKKLHFQLRQDAPLHKLPTFTATRRDLIKL